MKDNAIVYTGTHDVSCIIRVIFSRAFEQYKTVYLYLPIGIFVKHFSKFCWNCFWTNRLLSTKIVFYTLSGFRICNDLTQQ